MEVIVNSQDVMGLVLVYAIIAVSLAVAMILERRGDRNVRKVVHIGVGFFVFVWWMFSENWIMFVFFALPFALVLLAAMLKDNVVSESSLGDIANNQGHRTGLFFYVVSIAVMIVFFWDHWTAATVGIVAMTWGDGFGSVVGQDPQREVRRGIRRRVRRHRGHGCGDNPLLRLAHRLRVLPVRGQHSDGPGMGRIGHRRAPGDGPRGGMSGAVRQPTVLEAVCPGQYDNLVIPLVVASAMVLLGL